MKFVIFSIFLGVTLVGHAKANELVDLMNSYPHFVGVMPNDLDSHALKKTPVFKTSDYKMVEIRTVSVARLMELRGLPDMRCTNEKLESCIIVYGASDGAVVFHLWSDNMSFSHGIIYNNEGKASNEVIK